MTRYWIYKCGTADAAHRKATGDWGRIFTDANIRSGTAVDWGVIEKHKGLGQAKPGDLIIAQTSEGPRWIEGVAEVATPTRAPTDRQRIRLRPLERLRANLKVLKDADPVLAALPAFRSGPVATLFPIDNTDAERLLAAARAEDTRANPLHRHSMLLALGAARIDEGRYATKQTWRAGERAWQAAQQSRQPMAIIFGDATHDSGNLFRWALIDDLRASESGTHVSWKGVRAIHGHRTSDLIKVSDGQPLPPRLGRIAAAVVTPTFLQHESRRAAHEREALAQIIQDAENDPVAYEQVWRRLRRHQSPFRTNLMTAYGHRCAISGFDVPEVLEAAHIDAHAKSGDNRTDNGLLLRADLHALFDMGLVRIEPSSLRIDIHRSIRTSSYADLHGQQLRPRTDGRSPSKSALRAKWNAARTSAGDE